MDAIVQLPYDATVRVMLGSLERNLLPDTIIRRLTRLLLAARLRSGYKPSSELQLSDLLQFVHCTHLFSNSIYILRSKHDAQLCFHSSVVRFHIFYCRFKIALANHHIYIYWGEF
uniref:Putative ovule protein n=1 Tax=Solanum chacoense TaxID=4108 RepID=A0A0V0GXA5_SOLCH